MSSPEEFDVFLCHNSQDKPEVIEIANQLRSRGIAPWLDQWELRPGFSWQELLESQISHIKSAAVFVGSSGLGPWQKRELRAFLNEFTERDCPVIPVLLPNAPEQPNLPPFLKGMTWVDGRRSEALDHLIWGITGVKPSYNLKKTQPDRESILEVDTRNFSENLGNGVSLEMVAIPAGSFMMGAPEDEEDSRDSERPQHRVSVPAFLMGKYPVTQAQWKAVEGFPQVKQALALDPSRFKGDNRPVEKVSWLEAVEFCARLSNHSKRKYRLPSEAEWEYTCRAGTTTAYFFGDDTAQLENHAWYDKNSGRETHPVGQKPSNAFGLFDMHGNVWEWCEDDWHGNYKGAPTDGRAWVNNNDNRSQGNKLLRGCSWYTGAEVCRSAFRYDDVARGQYVSSGFRVVCSLR